MIARLVRALVPPASREHVLGDLLERYVSPRRYLLDALRTLPYIIASRLRRTTHPLGLALVGAFLWWAVFWGNRQQGPAVAIFPTLLTLAVLALRDVYRAPISSWARASVVDVAIAAGAVLLSQALFAFAAPALVLNRETLLLGFPAGFVILFFMRLQSPPGFTHAHSFERTLSLEALRAEIAAYERIIRRAVRIEIGACIVVSVAFFAIAWNAAPLLTRIGSALTSAAGLFVLWFLHRYVRVRPIPADRDFPGTIAAYRADLEHRRRLSNSYAWWYVLPLTIGIAVMVIGPQLQRPGMLPGAAVSALILAAVGTLLVLVQKAAAGKALRRIDQLRVLEEKMPAG